MINAMKDSCIELPVYFFTVSTQEAPCNGTREDKYLSLLAEHESTTLRLSST